MNLNEIKNELKMLFGVVGIRTIVVGGGAAMVFHGLRDETIDIDVAVSKANFELLYTGSMHVKKKSTLGSMMMTFQTVEVFDSMNDHTDVEFIDGFWVDSKSSLLKFYKKLNREKDQEWIKLLESWVHPNDEERQDSLDIVKRKMSYLVEELTNHKANDDMRHVLMEHMADVLNQLKQISPARS